MAVRLRRDFTVVLNLIKAHAILHQVSRERDDQGRIVASLDDYRAVRDLVSDLISEGIGASVSDAMRETVSAIDKLATEEGVTNNQLAAELQLDKSSASRRARAAAKRGFLRNLETKRGKPSRYVTGDPLPEENNILPTVAQLHGCSDNEGVLPPLPSVHFPDFDLSNRMNVIDMNPYLDECSESQERTQGAI